jgi:hypothetical protein
MWFFKISIVTPVNIGAAEEVMQVTSLTAFASYCMRSYYTECQAKYISARRFRI